MVGFLFGEDHGEPFFEEPRIILVYRALNKALLD